MWDLIVSVPDHCLSFYLATLYGWKAGKIARTINIHSRTRVNGCLTVSRVVFLRFFFCFFF